LLLHFSPVSDPGLRHFSGTPPTGIGLDRRYPGVSFPSRAFAALSVPGFFIPGPQGVAAPPEIILHEIAEGF